MNAHDSGRPPDTAREQQPTREPRGSLRAISLTRSLGLNELFFVALNRFTATQVTRVISLQGALPPRVLKRALRSLQTRHPLLRARIVEADGLGERTRLVHDDVPELTLQLIAREDDQHWQRVLEQVLNTRRSYATDSLFSVHYLWHEASARAELILAGEHALCDGVSMNALCAELLSLCAGEPAAGDARRLPALDELLPAFSPARRLLGFGRSLARLARVALTRSQFEERRAADSSAYTFVELNEAHTRRLLLAARAHGTSLTGVLMAAVCSAVAKLHPRTPRLALSVPINLRARLSTHVLGPEDVGNYTSVVLLSAAAPRAHAPLHEELWQHAQGLKQQLDQAAQSEGLLASASWLYRCGLVLVRAGKPTLAHAMVSNSGVVPLARDYGAFRPLAFHSATSAPLVSADLCFFCNSLHGRLSINLVFSERVVARADAERALEHVTRLLHELASETHDAP